MVAAIGFGFCPALAQDKVEADEQIGEEVGGPVIAIPYEEGAEFEESFGDKRQATWIPSWAFETDSSTEGFNSTGPIYSARYFTAGFGWLKSFWVLSIGYQPKLLE